MGENRERLPQDTKDWRSSVSLRRISRGFFLGAAIACLFYRSELLSWLTNIDPLSALAATLSSHHWTWSWGWGLALLTLIFGRFFCGGICPIGLLNHHLGELVPKSPPTGNGRFFKYGLLLVLLLVASLGLNLTGLLDPLSIFIRSGVLIAHFKETPWQSGIFLLLPAFILASNFVRPRFWCRYICPLGALLGTLSWLGIQRVQADQCVKCGRCSTKCQMGIQPAHLEGECINCGHCRTVCPRKDKVFAHPLVAPQPNRERRLLLGGVALMVPLFFLKRTIPAKAATPVLRPPGVLDEEEFLSRCTRCGLCTRICPSEGLCLSLVDSGLVGVMTPKFVPRTGPCLPTCNRCGKNCPTGAIPALPLEEKNQAKIGTAKVFSSKCYRCSRCVSACPYGALTMEELPKVNPALCVGCGKCENVCPADPAAIKVIPLPR